MSAKLPIGELFEQRYRVDAVLGSGGYGIVYAAHDVRDRRDVALKVLTLGRGAIDRSARQRFVREIEVVARLSSPHTVRLYGHGETSEGAPYAVFERIDGRDLTQLLAEHQRLPPDVVVQIVGQVCEALDEAHRLGLLHRDIKPANIRVDDTVEALSVKLLDFGIARFRDGGHPSLTRTGEMVGTPRYMSPEQLTGKDLAPSSDIYNLGMVAFELLMGASAIGTAWADHVERLRTGHIFSVPELERVGSRFLEVIQRMTAREPAMRYQSAAEVLDALRALGEQPVAVPERPGVADPVVRSATTVVERRSSSNIVIAALIAAAALVCSLVLARALDDPPAERRTSVPQALLETAEAEPTAQPVTAAADLGATGADAAAPDVGFDRDGGTQGCRADQPFVGRRDIGQETFAYVPKSYTGRRKVPLLVLLHQTYESAYEILTISGFEALAEEHEFIVVAPQQGDVFGNWRKEPNDLPTIRGVIDTMSKTFCIDPERIYLASNGHGGKVAITGSCEPFMAATAVHSFGNATPTHHCFDAAPAPHLLITPRSSPHVPFNGGNSCSLRIFQQDQDSLKMSVHEVEAAWRKRNRCKGEPEIVFEDGNSECRRWSCAAPFQSCYVEGGNGWTGSSPRAIADGAPCDGPPATSVELAPLIWSFFEHSAR